MRTTEIDSDKPNSHPFNAMMAIMLTITTETLKIAKEAKMMFPVAIIKTKNENMIAQIIP